MSGVLPLLTGSVRWLGRLAGFALYFGWELVLANATVAWEVATPGSALAPGITEVPLRCRTDLEIVTMSNLITLTPGTLTLAIRRDPPTLYVHASHAGDPDSFRETLDELECRILDVLRFEGRPDEPPAWRSTPARNPNTREEGGAP
ncbi:multicomponent Na+:H+ antiporter subunit E [Lipingzhangella halophila]|uniref:Multicomponent Na+:H+ antiporter subunit E n=1 Tax=Lipingzhangella halophila TaxID=1783352 RepID=A0A7W7RCQ8_9ACTN|nr:Na+/H+ antiporter subunit E [Lipingzhangella halophila]MBB4929450.1 multicomponent Na+:H+ antiporter subunit E [Lipingzhangella halophila]